MPRVRTEPVVFVGDKPTMTYVFEVLGQVLSGAPEVKVKARGKAISRAVDVAEVVRRHKLAEGHVQVSNVKIGTERLTNRDGKDANVSAIEIVLARTGEAPTLPRLGGPAAPAGSGAAAAGAGAPQGSATPKGAEPAPAGGTGPSGSPPPSP